MLSTPFHVFKTLLLTAVAAVLLSACTTNPVTGKRQLTMPIQEQIRIGEQQYAPAQQQQGGRYVVDPDLNVYVNQVGQKVAAASPVQLPWEFVVLNNDVPNAWALPGGKLAINRGLLVQLDDEAQLAAVLGHEVVHAAAEHSASQMTTQQILGVGVLAATIAAGQKSDNAALIGAGAAVGAKAFQAHYGRSQELEADFYGIDYMVAAGYDPQAAVELQEKFVAMSQGRESNWFSDLFASHPPSQERVDRNQKKASQLGSGKRNRSQYQQAIAQIVNDQAAYDLHQQALKAASEDQLDSALSLTDKAIAKQPEEALFYITKGQLLSSQKQTKAARDAFALAARKNPDYIMSQLGLGVAEHQLKNLNAARSALLRSYDILPTALAVYYLGEVEEASGNRDLALQYYQQAAGAGGDIGQAAQQKLRKLQPSSGN